MNIRSGINWTKSAIALTLLCGVFSFSVTAQNNSNKPLNKDEVDYLVSHLVATLREAEQTGKGHGHTLTEDQTDAIVTGWEARRLEEGKTQAEIFELLLSDMAKHTEEDQALFAFAVKDVGDKFWSGFKTRNDPPVKPVEPVKTEPSVKPVEPVKTEPSEEPIPVRTIRYYFANLRLDATDDAFELDVTKAGTSNGYLVMLVGLVFDKDKEGKLTGTGSFDLSWTIQGKSLDKAFIQILESKQIAGSKIVITGTEKPK